ncbi:diacylglycerol kinase [Roseovarius aquimarinus]|uniref:Diacylglycerol kinase n=1 Tax=Roseovarius aquimarinus TaxID=1229156 RepID=A0ABW7I7N7_9RHOB
MTLPDPEIRPRPPRVTGARHLVAATRYSAGGARRLWQETALRHIALGFAASLALLIWARAGLSEIAIFTVLTLILVAVEALNTAIECVVDHLAPDWQEFARDAKDLGSFATMCLLVANGLFLASVLAGAAGLL